MCSRIPLSTQLVKAWLKGSTVETRIPLPLARNKNTRLMIIKIWITEEWKHLVFSAVTRYWHVELSTHRINSWIHCLCVRGTGWHWWFNGVGSVFLAQITLINIIRQWNATVHISIAAAHYSHSLAFVNWILPSRIKDLYMALPMWIGKHLRLDIQDRTGMK